MTAEQISVVRSVVGSGFSEMDVIRALHLANNDPTAAINIIFDAPAQFQPTASYSNSASTPEEAPLLSTDRVEEAPPRDSMAKRKRPEVDGDGKNDDWWLVGGCEITGLSTCKGRRLKVGDSVTFSFPSPKAEGSPSTPKFPYRPRLLSSCSEIVRFSTHQSGEVSPTFFIFFLDSLVFSYYFCQLDHCPLFFFLVAG